MATPKQNAKDLQEYYDLIKMAKNGVIAVKNIMPSKGEDDWLDTWEDTYAMKKKKPKVEPGPSYDDIVDIAEALADELAKNGHGDFLFIKNDKVRIWYESVVKERAKVAAREKAIREREELREGALKKLSKAERAVLGLD